VIDRNQKVYKNNVIPDFEIIGGDDLKNLEMKVFKSLENRERQATVITKASFWIRKIISSRLQNNYFIGIQISSSAESSLGL